MRSVCELSPDEYDVDRTRPHLPAPPSPDCSMAMAREEFELVMFSTIHDLLNKTGVFHSGVTFQLVLQR